MTAERLAPRSGRLITALCLESAEKGCVTFGASATAKTFRLIRELMYEIYPRVNATNGKAILEHILAFARSALPDIDPVLFIALMTDQDVLYLAGQPVLDYGHLMQITASELLPILREKEIKWWEPDLDW